MSTTNISTFPTRLVRENWYEIAVVMTVQQALSRYAETDCDDDWSHSHIAIHLACVQAETDELALELALGIIMEPEAGMLVSALRIHPKEG